MQRHTLLMFTSCGWFFDEISGLETDQILQYAHRAMHYAEQVTSYQFRDLFLQKSEGMFMLLQKQVLKRMYTRRMGMMLKQVVLLLS